MARVRCVEIFLIAFTYLTRKEFSLKLKGIFILEVVSSVTVELFQWMWSRA